MLLSLLSSYLLLFLQTFSNLYSLHSVCDCRVTEPKKQDTALWSQFISNIMDNNSHQTGNEREKGRRHAAKVKESGIDPKMTGLPLYMRNVLPLHHAADEHQVKSSRSLFLKVNLLGLTVTLRLQFWVPYYWTGHIKKKQLALYRSSKVIPSSLSRISLMAAEKPLVVLEGLSENHRYGKLFCEGICSLSYESCLLKLKSHNL